MKMRLLIQIFAWACLAAIVALSLVAPSLRPVLLPHKIEHAAIFALAGLAIGLGYPNHAARNMIILTIFSALVELAQFYAPGRHPRVSDFVVDAAAACAGVALAAMFARLLPRGGATP
ncbi:MAG: VanZ family protein [Candidatus Binataceae bacterium]